ncbi:MAG TPA: hypothetical protein VEP91_09950 [Solirubrobacterales bacterium]|nr:hypothetical protein [Solirubrobacterales bacterium]
MEPNLLLSPPPFTTVQDDAFEEDMASIVPDQRLRDEVVNSMELAITRSILGVGPAIGRTQLPDLETELLVTQKTAICPALRVLFSVEDEPPERFIFFRRAGLKDPAVAS